MRFLRGASINASECGLISNAYMRIVIDDLRMICIRLGNRSGLNDWFLDLLLRLARLAAMKCYLASAIAILALAWLAAIQALGFIVMTALFTYHVTMRNRCNELLQG